MCALNVCFLCVLFMCALSLQAIVIPAVKEPAPGWTDNMNGQSIVCDNIASLIQYGDNDHDLRFFFAPRALRSMLCAKRVSNPE